MSRARQLEVPRTLVLAKVVNTSTSTSMKANGPPVGTSRHDVEIWRWHCETSVTERLEWIYLIDYRSKLEEVCVRCLYCASCGCAKMPIEERRRIEGE